jgi:hypothetical protein
MPPAGAPWYPRGRFRVAGLAVKGAGSSFQRGSASRSLVVRLPPHSQLSTRVDTRQPINYH